MTTDQKIQALSAIAPVIAAGNKDPATNSVWAKLICHLSLEIEPLPDPEKKKTNFRERLTKPLYVDTDTGNTPF